MSHVSPALDVARSARGTTSDRPRERRGRGTFWIDDRIIDAFAPVMRRYSFGSAALAVYAVLARRADREGHAWPSLALLAKEAGSCPRTVHKTLRLLEIAVCFEAGSRRQTSNLFTLLMPPAIPPDVDPDPATWPPPQRRALLIRGGNRAEAAVTTRFEPRALAAHHHSGASPTSVPRAGTLARHAPSPLHLRHPPPASPTPLSLHHVHPWKETQTKKTHRRRAVHASWSLKPV